ncbi:MAG TPA: hypothetical protein VGR81_11850 [Candidatus Acidoferrales bacterium]|nr:hypothetical protein [Candidatus Acidoferrales bacterium]
MKFLNRTQVGACVHISWRHRIFQTTVGACALLMALLVLFSSPVFAQSNALVDRLPADTWAYINWRGTSSLNAVSSTNSVLRFWSDPSFASLRTRFINHIAQGGNQTNPQSAAMTQMLANEILSALENPAVIGFLNRPAGGRVAGASSPVGFFFIFDATGKQDVVNLLRHMHEMNGSPASRTPLPVGDVTAEKVESNGNVSYDAQVGNYFISTDTFAALMELVPRFSNSRPPAISFEQASDIPSACRNDGQSSLMELFVLPSRLHVPGAPSSPDFDIHAFATSLHLDRIHAVCGRMSFGQQVTRWHGVILGDTSRGSVLDIFGDNRDSFATMALAPSVSSFQSSVLNFAAFYNTFFTAVTAALPANRSAIVMAMTSLLSSSWGMPPDQALGLFTGEVTSIRPDPVANPSDTLYALTIRNPEKLLPVLQHAFPGEQASTKQLGDTTYITVALGSSSTSAPDPPALYMALTPTMLLASHQRVRLNDALARLHPASGSAPVDVISRNPDFLRARAALPAKLDSLSYTNFARYNWQKMFADLQKDIDEQAQAAAKAANKQPPPSFDWIQGFNANVISRYLHFSVGGAWKDPSGIYFDSYIQ